MSGYARTDRATRSEFPPASSPRPVHNVLQGRHGDLDRRRARGDADAAQVPESQGAAVLESPLRPFCCRPCVIPLQSGESVGLDTDGHGGLILTVVDRYGNAATAHANTEETAGIAGEFGVCGTQGAV